MPHQIQPSNVKAYTGPVLIFGGTIIALFHAFWIYSSAAVADPENTIILAVWGITLPFAIAFFVGGCLLAAVGFAYSQSTLSKSLPVALAILGATAFILVAGASAKGHSSPEPQKSKIKIGMNVGQVEAIRGHPSQYFRQENGMVVAIYEDPPQEYLYDSEGTLIAIKPD